MAGWNEGRAVFVIAGSFFIFLFGLCIGSFLNVVIARTPIEEHLRGRSRCGSCKKQIRAYDNIPVVSFFILRGHCRDCHARISWQYPLVELATGLLMLAFVFIPPFSKGGLGGVLNDSSLLLVRNLVMVPVLILLFVYDLRFGMILDRFTLPAILVACAFNVVLGVPLTSMLWGALSLGGFFLAQFLVSRGAWIGGGDIRLGVFMGVLLGWQNALAALFIAYILGALVAVFLLATGRVHRKTQLPFGTFLTFATMVMLMFGDRILAWYSMLFA